MTNKNTLIIAPHPDDEVLGCGGFIKKLTLGSIPVTVLIMTRGKRGKYSDEKIERVREEALNAHKILGVNGTIFLDFPAPDLDIISLAEIAESISKVIREMNAVTIFIPHKGDIHHDHKVIFNASMVAARPVGRHIVRQVFAYETLSETEWAIPLGDEYFVPNSYVDITDVFSYKLDAMKCYQSQLREFPNPRSLETISALSQFRGSTVGLNRAEAFVAIRNIIY